MEYEETAPAPAPSLSPVETLAQALDIPLSEVPEDVTTKQEFIEWYNARATAHAPQGIIPQEVCLSFGSAIRQEMVKSFRKTMAIALASAGQRYSDALLELQRFNEKRVALLKELGTPIVDMAKELHKIMEDGWYTYVPNNGEPQEYMEFTTPPIELTHLELTVPMGSYTVRLTPYSVRVIAHEDNIDVGDYIHPHVSSSSDVCWGTAHELYTQGIARQQYASILTSLRAILTQYNAGSPYITLFRFGIEAGLVDFSEYTCEYNSLEDRVIVEVDNLPSDICTETHLPLTLRESRKIPIEEVDSYCSVQLFSAYYPDIDYSPEHHYYRREKDGGYALWVL